MTITYDINNIYPLPLGHAGDKGALTIKFAGFKQVSLDNPVTLIMGTPIEQEIQLDEDLTCTVTEDMTAKAWSDIPMRLQETGDDLINTSRVFFGEVN